MNTSQAWPSGSAAQIFLRDSPAAGHPFFGPERETGGLQLLSGDLYARLVFDLKAEVPTTAAPEHPQIQGQVDRWALGFKPRIGVTNLGWQGPEEGSVKAGSGVHVGDGQGPGVRASRSQIQRRGSVGCSWVGPQSRFHREGGRSEGRSQQRKPIIFLSKIEGRECLTKTVACRPPGATGISRRA